MATGGRDRSRAAGGTVPSGPALAERVVDAALLVTRLVRREVRRRQPAGLSVSQVRALSLLSRADDVSLAELAEYVGLGAPAASRLVEELVRRELVARQAAPADRRRLALRLLPAGAKALRLAVESARAPLVERLSGLPPAERARVYAAMASLLEVLSSPAAKDGLSASTVPAPVERRARASRAGGKRA